MKLTCVWPVNGRIYTALLDSAGDTDRFPAVAESGSDGGSKVFLQLALSAVRSGPESSMWIRPSSWRVRNRRTGSSRAYWAGTAGADLSQYMNNIIEQDHRFVKKRVVTSCGFRLAGGALSSIGDYRGHEHHSQASGSAGYLLAMWWVKSVSSSVDIRHRCLKNTTVETPARWLSLLRTLLCDTTCLCPRP